VNDLKISEKQTGHDIKTFNLFLCITCTYMSTFFNVQEGEFTLKRGRIFN
jgi:hypothetical protein